MKDIFKSKLFLIGLGIRILCLPLSGSYYLNELFIPFLDTAVQSMGSNPWSLMPPVHFPYGVVLFIILSLPRYLAFLVFGDLALGTTALGFILTKLPLLCIDILFLSILIRWNPRYYRSTLLYYWINPVLIFITFIHGQLDIASMFFCFAALFYLMQKRITASALLMGCAVLCKFHVIICVPLMIAYIYRRNFVKHATHQIARWSLVFTSLVAIGMIPIVSAQKALYVTTASPQAFRLFGIQLPLGDERVLFLGFIVLLLLLGRLCVSASITNSGLIYGSAVLFGTLLVVTDAMPGWYFWVLPFLVLFYAEYNLCHKSLLALFTGAYLATFAFIPTYFESEPDFIKMILFSVTQTFIIAMLAEIWLSVIRPELPLKPNLEPVIIGIAGDSGSGKDFLGELLQDVFNAHRTSFVHGDDYHRWQRGHKNWGNYTHLSPWANQLDKLALNTRLLRSGKSVFHHSYDHNTGSFTSPQPMLAKKTLIVQGLHTLYLKKLREQFDIKVFLNPSEDLRRHWKIRRDVEERKKEEKSVLKSMDERQEDASKYIKPQQQYADWIIEAYPLKSMEDDSPEMGTRHLLWNDIPLAALESKLNATKECKVSLKSVPDDMDRLEFNVSGTPTKETVEKIAKELFPNLRFLTRSRLAPIWRPGQEGVSQLICLHLIRAHLEAGQ